MSDCDGIERNFIIWKNSYSYHPIIWPALGPYLSTNIPIGNFAEQRATTAILKIKLNRLFCSRQFRELPKTCGKLPFRLEVSFLKTNVLEQRFAKKSSCLKTTVIDAHPYVIPEYSKISTTAHKKYTTSYNFLFSIL